MVWIHGGAYVMGNKLDSSAGNSSGLIAASQKDGSLGMIYVSINYRLGSLGFISGESYESEGGVSNLGLRDQRLALEWVQKYIHLFGGDPKKVTVSGGSAGAGSIIYHLISKSKENLPFQKAWVESPGLIPTSHSTRELAANKLLEQLGASSFAEARVLPSEQIIRANADVISVAKTGSFVYAPVEDGSYIPETAAVSLRKGNVHKGVKLMISHTKNEGYSFMPSYASTDDSFTEFLKQMFPYASESTISYIVHNLFPISNYGGLWYERVADFVGSFGLKCHAHALTKAYGNETYNYEWSVFPAFHGYDFLNVFFAGNRYGGIVNSTYAELLQSYIANFVKTGTPNGDGLLTWPVEGPKSQILNLTALGPVLQKDSTASKECLWLETHDLLM
ncbi:hypothetical protein G7Z17_g1843 [Cylindrodendrum hubeiense]|uniref:Carboxylic ester hydrolase n=1 Tax=Cylindrodendrum hubeiense TaxID=595255 RepID=A0A9P5LF03_9HYPO|nr:hypothetical protein G7Z17_g1843 [Cylindrodendrum hubeiense]